MKTRGMYQFFCLVFLLVIVATACGGTAPSSNTATIVPEKQDPALAVNSMDQVAIRVTNGTIDAWAHANSRAPLWWALFYALLTLIVCALVLGGMSNNMGIGIIAGAFVAIFVFFFVLVSFRSAMKPQLAAQVEKQATHAMKEGIDGARLDKATTYVEVLHVNVDKVDRDWRDCVEHTSYGVRYGDGSPSECVAYGVPEYSYKWGYQEHCTDITDDEGNKIGEDCYTDYNVTHVPYISKVVRAYVAVALIDDLADPETGLVPSEIPNHPRHYFDANWVVPEDYANFWTDANKIYDQPIAAPHHEQWVRYGQMLASGVNPQVNVYHIYTNWLLASDSELVKETSSFLAQYEAAGLLPTMNPIYNANGVDEWAVDYDMIQFMGMNVDPAVKTRWQVQFAREYSKYLSPMRQMSLSIVFAPASQVGDIDDYAASVKANYLDVSGKWDMTMPGIPYPVHRLLPKNAALIVCTVDDLGTVVLECRLTTAMPKGNEKLMDDFVMPSTPEMQGVPFTPEGFFGQFSLGLSDGSDGFIDVISLTFSGQLRPMSLLLREPEMGGIKREKMGSYAYRQANVVLDQTDIDNLVAKEVAVQQALAAAVLNKAFWAFWGLVIGIVVVFFGLVLVSSQS